MSPLPRMDVCLSPNYPDKAISSFFLTVIGADGKLRSFLEMAGESQKFHKPGTRFLNCIESARASLFKE
jgi:hypothetical protein